MRGLQRTGKTLLNVACFNKCSTDYGFDRTFLYKNSNKVYKWIMWVIVAMVMVC